ncbi:MAG: hypothetical protein MI741_18060 [Rhodospirillales bacterium]|nr:hypothetical protein [Rhodospirillales bacterium]
MNVAGWIVMLGSVGFVTCLLGWCIYKVVSTPGATDHIHSQADITTPDTQNE